MFKNYFKVAFRNIVRYKGYSFINVFGLAIGMTACLLILYFVNYERSYDKFHENSNRIYRLRYERTDQGGQSVRFASCCPPAGLRIRKQCPEVEKVARLFQLKASVSYENNKFIEERMFFAEPDFFEIFKYKFLEGNPLNGIKEPNTAFISQSTAKKYFGDKDPVGKIISVDKKTNYQITGVFKDIPSNSHLKFDIILSYKNLIARFGKEIEDSWGDSGWFTYLLLKPNTNIDELNRKIAKIVETEFGEVLRYFKLTCNLILQPLNDIHLSSNFMQEYETNGDKNTIKFLMIIAIFIIVIAWVNYINLSTARSLTRAKEVGLRKVAGAFRSQLMMQLFSEIALVNIIAMLFTFILLTIFLPFYRQITGTGIDYSIWSQLWFWDTIGAMLIIGILLSGIYPVMILSSFKPIDVLRGKIGNSIKGINLRKMLVSFQFVMAIGMLICTFVIFKQLSFIKKQDLGFTLDNKLIIRAPRVRDAAYTGKLQTFKEQILSNPNISKFCISTDVPGKQVWWDAGGIARLGSKEGKNYQIVGVDYDFINVFGFKFVSGRNFSREFPSDSSALILNEIASKWLGFESPQAAIGQKVDYWEKIYTVIGVLKDYHQQSLKQAFEPHIFRFTPEGRDVRGLFTLTLNTKDIKSTVNYVKKYYDEFFPDNPYEYFFLDEYYNRQYKADEKFGKVFGIFSFLAIFITCLGVIGLSSFTVIQRKKEIGVRKVLGASIFKIIVLLSKNFQILILFAFIIAAPISYYVMNNWLESFAVRMIFSIDLFVMPLIIVSVITNLTIFYHVVKAAITNPVESLKYE